jgi:hypothetical protein
VQVFSLGPSATSGGGAFIRIPREATEMYSNYSPVLYGTRAVGDDAGLAAAGGGRQDVPGWLTRGPELPTSRKGERSCLRRPRRSNGRW